jgi:hypothetical protein
LSASSAREGGLARGAARSPERVVGLLVVADSGTVFLDEIRDLRLDPGDCSSASSRARKSDP